MSWNALSAGLRNFGVDLPSPVAILIALLALLLALIPLWLRLNLTRVNLSEKKEKTLRKLLKQRKYLDADALSLQLALRPLLGCILDERLFYFAAARHVPLRLLIDIVTAGDCVRLRDDQTGFEDMRARIHILGKEWISLNAWAWAYYLGWLVLISSAFETWLLLHQLKASAGFLALAAVCAGLFFINIAKNDAATRLLKQIDKNHPLFVPPKRPEYVAAYQAGKSRLTDQPIPSQPVPLTKPRARNTPRKAVRSASAESPSTAS